MTRAALLGLMIVFLHIGDLRAEDAEIGKRLKENGAKLTEAKGVVTGVDIPDCSKWAEADFRQLDQLKGLKSLSFSAGLTEQSLPFLTGLSELESLQTNLLQVTDDGIKPLAQMKKLTILKFFHPGKDFTGAGLVHLKDLPHLERLTVAGSLAFNDDGMAAVAQLPHLKEFRTWHAGPTLEGVKKLKDLKNLTSLTLGQRLTYQKPACPTDATVAVVAELKSLESLQLGEARLTLGALTQLKQLTDLKKLTLDGIDMPEADVVRLQKELTKVDVKWSKPNEAYTRRIRALFGE
jgi:hypothetical protein